MKKLKIVFIALLIFVMSSCRTVQDERINLNMAQKSLKATVKSLTTLRKAKKLSESDIANIDRFIDLTNDNLKVWEKAILAGQNRPEYAKIVQINLDALTEILKEKQTKRGN